MRAWIHAEENKRRTLQRSDIASALSKSDMFDFLIDIVPREEIARGDKRGSVAGSSAGLPSAGPAQMPQQGSGMPPPPGHPGQQHPMQSDYGIGHPMGPEQDYRQQPNLYAAQVQPPAAPYGGAQQQIYGDMENIYGYPQMQPQQVCFETSIPEFRD